MDRRTSLRNSGSDSAKIGPEAPRTNYCLWLNLGFWKLQTSTGEDWQKRRRYPTVGSRGEGGTPPIRGRLFCTKEENRRLLDRGATDEVHIASGLYLNAALNANPSSLGGYQMADEHARNASPMACQVHGFRTNGFRCKSASRRQNKQQQCNEHG
jgi:hypothetical protein